MSLCYNIGIYSTLQFTVYPNAYIKFNKEYINTYSDIHNLFENIDLELILEYSMFNYDIKGYEINYMGGVLYIALTFLGLDKNLHYNLTRIYPNNVEEITEIILIMSLFNQFFRIIGCCKDGKKDGKKDDDGKADNCNNGDKDDNCNKK